MANQVNGDSLNPPSVVNLARVGDVRAIAHWLNACLVPQGIYARVSAAKPGYLRVTVEFERSPERDRLIRFICHRLCKLNSSRIKGVQIVARWADTLEMVWKQSVRINTPASRTSKSTPLLSAARNTALLKHQPSPLVPSISQQLRSRSLLLSGSAAAAFLVGCGVEVLIQHTGALASQSGRSEATTVSTSQPTSERSNIVQTAQDEVAVFQQPVLNPHDPTVTLTFGDDTALGTVGATSTFRVSSAAVGNQSSRADVATAHLDAPLVQVEPDSLEDETAPEQLQTLIDSRINLVSLGSDRVMRQGADGLEETLEALEQFGIHSVGAGRNRREATRPEILDVKGQRIAYLGYSDSNLKAARDRAAGVNANPDRRIAADIRAIRDQVDWVVVNYHWSQDLEAYPTREQVDLAHLAIDQGADLVVGYHPNVLQGAEIYKGRAIAYSLGNFIFAHDENNSITSANDYDTAVLKVSLRENQMRLEFLPVEVRQNKPEIVAGEKADAIVQYIQQASSPFAQPLQSSIVLDKRSPDTPPEILPPEIPAELSIPEPDQPPIPNAEPSQPSDSFITYPDASTDEMQSDDMQPNEIQPDVTPINPSEPFTTDPTSDPDVDSAGDTSEPFHAWPDAQLPDPYSPDPYSNDAAEINAVQLEPKPELQQAQAPGTAIALPSPSALAQSEPAQLEQVDQATSLSVQPEQIQTEEQVARPPISPEHPISPGQLTVLKPQAAPSASEPNAKPAL